MSQRKRRIIMISIISAIAVVVLAIAGVVAYATTDLFKSNERLFFKYASEVLDSLKYVENTQIAEIEKQKDQKPYETNGKLIYEQKQHNAETKYAQINIQKVENSKENQTYAKFDLLNNNQNIFTVEYAKDGNIYALKSDEIVSAFLGIENENIEELAKKIGIENTEVLPNTIKATNINELLKLTEEEKSHIKETYASVIKKAINKNNFIKEKGITVIRDDETYNATAYRLSLTGEELKKVETEILKALKEDNTTLNIITAKAKKIGISENYAGVQSLKAAIQKQIDTIESKEVGQNDGISIMIHVSNMKVINTEIIYKNTIKYTIYGTSKENESRRYILVENLDANSEYSKIEINEEEKRSTTESTYNVNINVNNEIRTNIAYTSKTTFKDTVTGLVKLNRTNCGILNYYETEQLRALLQAVTQKASQVITQKLQILKFIEPLQNEEQAVEQGGNENV